MRLGGACPHSCQQKQQVSSGVVCPRLWTFSRSRVPAFAARVGEIPAECAPLLAFFGPLQLWRGANASWPLQSPALGQVARVGLQDDGGGAVVLADADVVMEAPVVAAGEAAGGETAVHGP